MSSALETELLDLFDPDNFPASKEDAATAWDAALRYLLPPKAVILANLSSGDVGDTSKFSANGLGTGDYLGWAICNGNNGTPNLSGKFPRLSTSAAAGTGGSDSSAHTHSLSGHTHAAGTFRACANDSGGHLYTRESGTSSWTATTRGTLTATAASSVSSGTGTELVGASAVPSNDTTGAASATENRPAYYELVPLMRV